ncbi:MAG: O-antigen ligase family protein [Acidobacteria bacterium]|nr:O-antigen ligase family protein [Acidobacteriota bacterium]
MIGYVLSYVITALASLAALRRPLIGLYAYVGFAILRPQFIFRWAGDLSNLSLILGVALLAGWAINGFGKWEPGRSKPVVYALLTYTGCYIASASLAEFTDASFKAVLELLKIVLPFCVGLTMIKEEREWKTLLWVIVLAQGYVGFEQNLNYVRGYNTAADGFGGMDNNCFGVSLVTVFGAAVGLVLISRKWWERAAAGTAAALILHTTLLTFSRGAMIGLLVIGVTAFITLPKRPAYVAWILVAALVAVRLTGPQLLARYSTVVASSEERDGSAQSRLDLWADTLKVIATQPVLGVGPANWRLISYRYGWPPGKSAHSVWMETGAEVGVPGTLALLAFFGFAALRLWPLARKKVTSDNYYQVGASIGVILGAVGFITSGQFVSVVGLEAPYYIVLVGVIVIRDVHAHADEAAVSQVTAVTTGAAVVRTVSPTAPAAAARRPTRPKVASPGGTRLIPELGVRSQGRGA